MHNLLTGAGWVSKRTPSDSAEAERNSLTLYEYDDDDAPVGVIRAITDKVTVTYLCDLFVTETHRGRGLGRKLMERLLQHPDVAETTIVLITAGAEEFYRKFNFQPRTAMVRKPDGQSS